MFKVIILAIFQCFLLASGQVFFKLGVMKIPTFQWTWTFFLGLFSNLWLYISIICLAAATLLWGYILKHFEFSIAHPLTAFSFVFGMLAAIFIFHENVSLMRWIGVALIIAGVFFITK